MPFDSLPATSSRGFLLAIATAGTSLIASATQTLAQVVIPDATVGTQTQSDHDGFTITGGTIRGHNLFHSFEIFSPQNQSVLFDLTASGAASQGIERIFSRVTGTQASRINGLLQTQGGNHPDLFLLNPKGILLGPNAQINLGGSFIGTTGETIQFLDGTTFSVNDLHQPAPLLSVSVPFGIQMGQAPETITVEGLGHHLQRPSSLGPPLRSVQDLGAGLQIPPGQSLTLLGGEIQMQGGIIQSSPSSINTPFSGIPLPWGGIHLNLASVTQGTVLLQPDSSGWSINQTAPSTAIDPIRIGGLRYGNLSFSNQAWLDASGIHPSNITIWGQDLKLTEGSIISMENFGAQANGVLEIMLTGQLSVGGRADSTGVSSALRNSASDSGAGGIITVWAENLRLFEGGAINASTYGSGNSGDIRLRVNHTLQIQGDKELQSADLSPTAVSSSTLGPGRGGALDIDSKTLEITAGALLGSASFSTGAGGNLDLRVTEKTLIHGSSADGSVPSVLGASAFARGDAGQVRLETGQFSVLDGGTLDVSAYASGNAGDVWVRATERIQVEGQSSGNGLPAQIGSSVLSRPIPIPFLETSELTGNAGSVTLAAPKLQLRDGGTITVTNQGSGSGGVLTIEAEHIALEQGATIAAITNAVSLLSGLSSDGFNSGSIRINASDTLTLREGSRITASANGDGIGGNILIQAPRLVAVPKENSDISANATTDLGGKIQLDVDTLIGLRTQSHPTSRSDITASSALGASFSGTVTTGKVQTTSGVEFTQLSSELIQADEHLAQACEAHGDRPITQISLSGRGGLPVLPSMPLNAKFIEIPGSPIISAKIYQAIELRQQGFYAKALASLDQMMIALDQDGRLLDLESTSNPANPQAIRQAILKATVHREIGITLALKGNWEKAQTSFTRSQLIANHLYWKDQRAYQLSATHLSMGNLARQQGQVEQARSHYSQALKILESYTLTRTDTKAVSSSSNRYHANLQARIQANQLTLEASPSSKAIIQKLQTHLRLFQGFGDLDLQLHLVATQLQDSHLSSLEHQEMSTFVSALIQILNQAKAADDQRAMLYTTGYLGQAHIHLGQQQQARQFLIQSLNLAQARQDALQEYQWAWQLGRIASSRAEAIAAYQDALDALQRLRGDLATTAPEFQTAFRTEIEPVYREYMGLLLTLPPSQTSSSEDSQLNLALEIIEALRLAELDDFWQDTCLQPQSQGIEQLDEKAAIIHPIVLEDRLELIVSLPDGQRRRYQQAITAPELIATVKKFRQELVTRSRRNYEQPGQQLYDWLIRPMLAELSDSEIQTLVFVPDGPLKNIPMAALWDGEQFLVEQFTIANTPGMKLLKAKPTEQLDSRAFTAGMTQARQGFPALPNVSRELDDVQSLLPGTTLLNEAFTQQAFEAALKESSAPIVHIATHGQFSSRAEETYILAWDERIDILQLSELLKARDRRGLSPIELLVLSACETALGDDAAALGLAGMAVRAGARSTLASLWSVNDDSTAQLMHGFYQQLSRTLKAPQQAVTKSEALQEAQLKMLQHEQYRHPYYWSAFVLLGDWQ